MSGWSLSSASAAVAKLLSAAVLALVLAAPAEAQFINGSFIKGCNLAWENGNYNTWLGVDPTETSWGCTYNSGDLNSYMANMHNMGITVLRVWINEGDMGDTIDGSDNVTGVTSLWSSNFANMVQLAANNQIQLYITLNNGRADWLENTSQAAAYLNNALIPLVKQYKGNTTIFAIERDRRHRPGIAGELHHHGRHVGAGAELHQDLRVGGARRRLEPEGHVLHRLAPMEQPKLFQGPGTGFL